MRTIARKQNRLSSHGGTTRKSGSLLLAIGFLLALPTAALAQSSIAGTVKDASDAVLPGVAVTISSPAMIEGTKEATTDGSGQYRFIDLRPGMYTIKFALEGFATIERTGFQLQSDVNPRIDMQMKVGTINETITVTGVAPIVDVQSAAHVAVLDRDSLDNIPTSKTIWSLGQLILGVQMSAPDVGGSASGMPTYMALRGGSVGANNNTIMVDGMVLNALSGNGQVPPWVNDANFQEVTYQTAGIGAERSGGGVVVNMVPKEGGNQFSGSGGGAYRPGELQGDNYSDRFKVWGLPLAKGEPAINRVVRISDFSLGQGGPLQKDKLWFFVAARDQQPHNTVPNTFLDDGSQGVDDNSVRNVSVRLTYQVSPRHKLSANFERVFWHRGHAMAPLADPETTAQVWTSPNFSTMGAKYTGTLSSKFLIEGGFAQNTEYYRISYQPDDPASNRDLPYTTGDIPGVTTFGQLCCGSGIRKDRYSPAWYAYVPHATAGGGGTGVATAAPTPYIQFPLSQSFHGSASYVTGSHHATLGFSLKKGKFLQAGDVNAHMGQLYPTSVRDLDTFNVTFPSGTLSNAQFTALFPTTSAFPYSATNRPCNPTNGTATQCRAVINNFPLEYSTTLNYDLGIFLQDSYTLKRLTFNAGLRYEALNAQVNASHGGLGRFVPVRDGVVHSDIPNWRDWAPRFQMIYDVFGNSKTAVKYSINRYNEGQTTGLAETVNPAVYTTNTRFWTDLNNDDIAQGQRTFNADGTMQPDCIYLTPGCEINLSGIAANTALSPEFGTVGSGASYTNFPRRYRFEQGIEVQHALLPRLSVNGTYYHGVNRNLTRTVNRARTDDGTKGTQYRQVKLFNPLDGTPYVYYAYTPTVALPTSGNIVYVEPKFKSVYDTYAAEIRLRPYAGAQLSGGIEFARSLTRDCESSYVKDGSDGSIYNDGSTAVLDPNALRFCDQWNMVAYEGGPRIAKPFSKNFKMSGSFPTIYGLNVGLSYQNLDAGGLSPTYQYGAARIYPDGTQKMLGGSTLVPACPTAYGCVPGGPAWVAGTGAEPAAAIGSLFAPGAISDERIVQLDVKVSKNLRFGRISVQPSFEAFNLMNIDAIRARASSQVGIATGGYLQPSTMLQGRIIGFGANVKW